MPELDHIFCLSPVGAEVEARALQRIGLLEGSRNNHPGQGTACRRFFFENVYIELLWVSDPNETQCELTRRTRLWERWSKRESGASPFGVVLRAGDTPGADCPFASWAYHPSYLPPNLSIDIAEGTPLKEPEFLYLGFQRGRAREGTEPTSHRLPVTKVTSVVVSAPTSGDRSTAARALETMGPLRFAIADEHVISLTFDSGAAHKTADLRPDVPMLLQW